MALTGKKYENFYRTTGGGSDEVPASKLTKAEEIWDLERAKGMDYYMDLPEFAPIIFQLQQMQDELDYLRTEISSNKDKATFPGFGTSGSTALVGNTPLLQIGTTNKTALAGDTALLQLGTTSSTALRGDTEIPPITIKLGTGITLTLVVELDGRGSGVVGAVVEDTGNRKTYTGSISLTEKR
tara:strand:+ start:233 stop:781 length:549 start_codon:yes stop_codon:yes gene_type:complete